MVKFTFNRGAWDAGHTLPDWQDGEDNISYVARLGYSTVGATYGTEFGGEIEIYEAHDSQSFYALVSPTGNTSFEVFLPDFPSYMLFMKEYVTAFAAGGADATQKDIMALLSKFFQAEHGHDESDICSRCDPVGWKRRLEAARQRHTG